MAAEPLGVAASRFGAHRAPGGGIDDLVDMAVLLIDQEQVLTQGDDLLGGDLSLRDHKDEIFFDAKAVRTDGLPGLHKTVYVTGMVSHGLGPQGLGPHNYSNAVAGLRTEADRARVRAKVRPWLHRMRWWSRTTNLC